MYRTTFGLQQMCSHPLINLLWIVYLAGIFLLFFGVKWFESIIEAPTMMLLILHWCLIAIKIIFPVLCAFGVCQFIGYLYAKDDEADMRLIFGNKRDIRNQPPILIYKKKSSGITTRTFYTSIPMTVWKDNKEAICDRLDIHLIGDISYGGKNQNKGNLIRFKSANGRTQTDRGEMYDEEF